MSNEKQPERLWIVSPVEFNSLISKAGPAFDTDTEYVRADLAAPAQWLDISSAPKDGTVVWIMHADGIAKALYGTRKDIWVSPDGGYGYTPLGWLPLSAFSLPFPPAVPTKE